MASSTSEGYQAWVKHRRDCVVCCSTIRIRCDAEMALRDKFLKEYKARVSSRSTTSEPECEQETRN